MSENINKGGRGFNVVTLNKDTLQLISTMHADTYTYGKLNSNCFTVIFQISSHSSMINTFSYNFLFLRPICGGDGAGIVTVLMPF